MAGMEMHDVPDGGLLETIIPTPVRRTLPPARDGKKRRQAAALQTLRERAEQESCSERRGKVTIMDWKLRKLRKLRTDA